MGSLHRTGIAAALIAMGPLSLSLGAEPATSPEQIRPLLIGTALPDLTLQDVDGKPVKLGDVGSDRAVLIFYRGGW